MPQETLANGSSKTIGKILNIISQRSRKILAENCGNSKYMVVPKEVQVTKGQEIKKDVVMQKGSKKNDGEQKMEQRVEERTIMCDLSFPQYAKREKLDKCFDYFSEI